VKTVCFSHLYIKTPSFDQDRLGTNIGKELKKKFVISGGVEDGSYMCLLFDTIETVPEGTSVSG